MNKSTKETLISLRIIKRYKISPSVKVIKNLDKIQYNKSLYIYEDCCRRERHQQWKFNIVIVIRNTSITIYICLIVHNIELHETIELHQQWHLYTWQVGDHFLFQHIKSWNNKILHNSGKKNSQTFHIFPDLFQKLLWPFLIKFG